MAIIRKLKSDKCRGGAEKVEHSEIAGVNKMVKPLWKTVWEFLNRLNIELPHHSAISL